MNATVERRHFSADARNLETWRVENGALVLREPDLDRRVAGLSALYPRLLDAAALPDLPHLGPLEAEGRFQGPLVDPVLALEARLRPGPAGRIDLSAVGPPMSGPLRVTSTGTEVELGGLVAGLTGRVDWRGTVEDALGAADGSLQLTGRSIATDSGPLAESLAARLSGDRGRYQ